MLVILVSVLLVAISPRALGLQVTGLYSHELPVANESDAERSRAFSAALSAVIVKLTGTDSALRVPGVERALSRAGEYVEGVSYSSGGGDTVQRSMKVDFSPSLVEELLRTLGIPIWNSNRPSVLVWIVLQNAEGERRLMNPELDQEISDILSGFAMSRGLPLIYPVLDFEDRRNLSEGSLWDFDAEAIAAASRRYGPDSILAGRIHFTPGNELVGLWRFQFQGEVEVFDGLDVELSAYLESPLEQVTEKLANYFALPSVMTIEQLVRLRVDGVRNLEDYAALLSYVQGLGIVEDFALAELEAERIELNLRVLGTGQRLGELIALDRNLIPIDSAPGSDAFLHYRWTR